MAAPRTVAEERALTQLRLTLLEAVSRRKPAGAAWRRARQHFPRQRIPRRTAQRHAANPYHFLIKLELHLAVHSPAELRLLLSCMKRSKIFVTSFRRVRVRLSSRPLRPLSRFGRSVGRREAKGARARSGGGL